MNKIHDGNIKLTSFSHGGGCGCKIAPGILAEILKSSTGFPVPKELMVGIETADDAAVYKLNEFQTSMPWVAHPSWHWRYSRCR
jgi:selenide,water dikinase